MQAETLSSTIQYNQLVLLWSFGHMLGSSGIAPLDRTLGLKQHLLDIDGINILFVAEKQKNR